MYMYKNILIELVKKDMTKQDLAKKAGIKYNTFLAKLNGRRDFTCQEAQKIQSALNTDMSFKELFKR